MNIDDVRCFLVSLSRIVPTFARWRRDTLTELAKANQTKASDEAREMTASWARTLEDVANDDAIEVLERIEKGRLVPPHFGELARWVRREALAIKHEGKKHVSLVYSDEQRFRCAVCRDRGIVSIINPEFARAYRETFESMIAEAESGPPVVLAPYLLDRMQSLGLPIDIKILPPGWFADASKWWRQQGGQSPVVGTAACHCDAGESRREKLVTYRENVHPVLVGSLYEKSFREWYASGKQNATEWMPAAGEYDERFN